MKRLTTSDVRWLIEHRDRSCVSVYMTVDPVRPGGTADRARLDDLLREAERRLERGEDGRDAERLLAPIAEKVRGPWPARARGIALFRCPDINLAFQLPVEVPDVTVVASTFHTKPLVSYLDRSRHFFVLALAEDSVRLLEGNPEHLVDVTRDAIPTDLHSGVYRPAARRFGAHGGMGAHGGTDARALGDRELAPTARLRGWYRALEEAVTAHLRPTEASLVLAGPRSQQALFRSVSRYLWLLDGGVDARADALAPEELHSLACAVVGAHQAELESEAATQYLDAVRAGKGTDVLAEVIAAASEGRVRLLLHREGMHVWGWMDPETGAFALRGADEEIQPGDSDLVDDLCEATLVRGGYVIELPPGRMPTSVAVAAILT